MSEIHIPANSNTALKDLIANPRRKLAKDSLAQTLYLLKQSGVPRDQLTEVHFELLRELLVPDSELDGISASTWYAQLSRFRDELQRQIDSIEAACDRLDH